MALNFSQRPIFPAHTSEDSFVSPLRMVNGQNGRYAVEGMSENGELHDRYGHGRETTDKGGSPDSVSKDIIDMLPSDPFGMEIDISTTLTAITGWLGDLEMDYGEYMRNRITTHNEDHGLFAGFSFFWNKAMTFQSFPTNFIYPNIATGSYPVHQHHSDDITSFDHTNTSVYIPKSEEFVNTSTSCPEIIGEDPHDALVFALRFLETKDLLMMERVCIYLSSTIRHDPLLWRNLHIDQPLNEKITDDILVELTNRAEGSLQSLSLLKCPKITDDGLRRVLETNPKLTKLTVPGCTRLTIEGILNNLKSFNATAYTGIKHIRTGGFYGITLDHFEELKRLLGIEKDDHNPQYYHQSAYNQSDDDRAIDVEVCPRCENLRLVYACPAASCQVKDGCEDFCRACVICIPRCVECGRCVHNSEYEETFSLEYLCSECLKRCQVPRG